MGRRWISLRRKAAWKQAELPFLDRRRRLDRAFKSIIVAATAIAVFGLVFGTSAGRRSASRLEFRARAALGRLLGTGVDRAELEAQLRRDRLRGVELVRGFLGEVGVDRGPKMREFLRAARMDSESAVVRWGNFDGIIALSSAVFEPDDAGRSYRLRPDVRSIWLINLTINKVPAMFEILDTPEVRKLGESVGGQVVPESVQTTNSWGCRGPEPDPKAAIRGMVLGDSMMQGLLVGDNETPAARLEVELRDRLGVSVSILNTGTLGYSPEQYYHTLVAYYERFRPHFVVVSLCGNDFGNMNVEANWEEGEYWLDAITQFCRTNEVAYLVTPLPMEDSMVGNRDESTYPGRISRIFDGSGMEYLYPIEEFTAEHLRLRAGSLRDGHPIPYSLLFNRKYNDNHFSAKGCDLWARIVARRVEIIRAIRGLPRGQTAPIRDHESASPGR